MRDIRKWFNHLAEERKLIDEAISKQKKDEFVNRLAWYELGDNSIHRVALRGDLTVYNPIIKQTSSGKRYIEHKQVPRVWKQPSDCFCHERSYLGCDRIYFLCNICFAHHHIDCLQSPYLRKSELLRQDKWYCKEHIHLQDTEQDIYRPKWHQDAEQIDLYFGPRRILYTCFTDRTGY